MGSLSRFSTAARLVNSTSVTLNQNFHPVRLLRNGAATSSSQSATKNASRAPASGLKDPFSVSKDHEFRAASKDLTKIFEVDHTLPTKSTIEIIRALSIYHL